MKDEIVSKMERDQKMKKTIYFIFILTGLQGPSILGAEFTEKTAWPTVTNNRISLNTPQNQNNKLAIPIRLGWNRQVLGTQEPLSQTPVVKQSPKKQEPQAIIKPIKSMITIGVLNGGGGLIGIDYKRHLFKKFSAQIGWGWDSYIVGVLLPVNPTITNYWSKKTYLNQPSIVRPSIFLSFYNKSISKIDWNQQGIGLSYVMPSPRTKYTLQIGIGYIMYQGRKAYRAAQEIEQQKKPSRTEYLFSFGRMFY